MYPFQDITIIPDMRKRSTSRVNAQAQGTFRSVPAQMAMTEGNTLMANSPTPCLMISKEHGKREIKHCHLS